MVVVIVSLDFMSSIGDFIKVPERSYKKVGEFSLEEYINKDRGDYPELIGMSKEPVVIFTLAVLLPLSSSATLQAHNMIEQINR